MLLIKKLLAILILSIFLISCSSSKQTVQVHKIPSWFLKQSSNNANYIYGVSEAFTLKEAKLQALAQMSQRLIVSVDSSFSSSKSSNGSLYSKVLKQDIKQKSKKIEFNNYLVEHAQNINGRYYVQVKVNRIKLFNTTKIKFDSIHKSIVKTVNSINNLSILEKIQSLQSTQNKVKEAKELLYILRALNNSFEYFSNLDVYMKIQDDIAALQSKIIISIQSNVKNNLFKNKVINLLNTNNYKVSKQSNTRIQLQSTIVYSKAYGWHIAKVLTNINVISDDKILSNNSISSVGRSSSSRQNALVNAAKSFEKDLKKLGIEKLLFN